MDDEHSGAAPRAVDGPARVSSLLSAVLDLGPHIRYAALAGVHGIETRERAGLKGGSSADSDFFEELLVNPTILGIASRRGNFDCGGLRYVIIGYGLFNQVVLPTADGHLSVAVERETDPRPVIEAVVALIRAAER